MRYLAIAALLLAASPALAQDAEKGAESFALYCATCHGSDATGNGPTAELLVIETPDLTALQGDGDFPMFRVARRIDGRDMLAAHGGPMPLFGAFFEGRDVTIATSSGQPLMTSEPVADLLAYIASVQR